MEARRLRLAVALGLIVLAQTGCRAPAATPSDPFAATPQGAAEATAAAPPGASITPASYDAKSPEAPAPGSSLTTDLENQEPSFWDKVGQSMSGESMSKQYKAMVGRAPDEAIAREAYNKGDQLFREGKYEEAADEFEIAAERWPESLLEEDSLYMLGESFFFADQYHHARNAFDKLLDKYENSRHLDRVTARQFSLGRFWDEAGRDKSVMTPNFFDKTRPWFDTHGHGLKVYENIRLKDPTGPLADDALMAQGTAYFRDGRYDDAAFQYEVLRKDYPQSEHQKQAHLLGLQSYLNAYQGPQYDPSTLIKAEKLADSTLRNLGHQMPEEKPRLLEAKAAIRAQTAERDYDLGEYYRKLGYNQAARHHYAIVLRDFPDTKFASLAQKRMEETEGLAPEPPDYFPWLTKWLGSERTENR
jgi:outer membrane protein assembly factor BamD (BamD/ComL family)